MTESCYRYDKSKNQIGYEINSSNGTITANSNYFVSDYVNVEGMSNVYVSGERTTGNSFCFYDANKTFLSTYRIFDNNNSYVGNVVVPTNAVYMRFNGVLHQQDLWISKDGKIIHEKDLDGVLLWRNGSPNANFSAQHITFSRALVVGEYLNIEFTLVAPGDNQTTPIQKFKINNNSGQNFCINGVSAAGDRYAREGWLDSTTTLYWGNGYKNNTAGASYCIPRVVYASDH